MSDSFPFAPFSFSKREREALKGKVSALDGALRTAKSKNGSYAKLEKRRDDLAGQITSLESGEGDPTKAAAQLPALREEAHIIGRRLEQAAEAMAPGIETVREPLRALATEFSGAMKTWFGRTERLWAIELAPLYHGDVASAAGALKNHPLIGAVSLAAIVNPRSWGNPDSTLGVFTDAERAIVWVRAVLDGKNPWICFRTSPRML